MAKKARPIATIDCETDPFLFGRVPLPFLWDYFDGARHFTIEKTSDFMAFLKTLPPTICYAHNGGKFDYHMPGFLSELEPFSKVTIINGRLAKFTIGNVEFRDSINILPIALADYKKEDIDYQKMEADVRHLHMEEITKYLHKDTEYLYELVSQFRRTYGDGLTLAGSAMKFWTNRTGIAKPRTTAGFYHELSKFYYGGRVECFAKGLISDNFQMVDINSAYPFAMLCRHPFGATFRKRVPDRNLPREEIDCRAFYEVECQSNGALPCRNHGGGLSFPVLFGVFYVSGWELRTGLSTGTVTKCRIIAEYAFGESIDFVKYINYFYDIKKSAKKDSAEYLFAKLFMNSLYGKFGANPENYSNYEVIPPEYVEAAKADGAKFGGELGQWAVAETPLEEEQKWFFNVATAASITGFVRAYLWEHICKIRANGGKVYYCDTDSIVFSGSTDGFRFDNELGGWSMEPEFVRGGIAGKKMYCFEYKEPKTKGGKMVRYKYGCKGVRITPEEILRVCAGETVTYKRDAPSLGIRSVANPKTGEAVAVPTVRFTERRVRTT